MVFGILRTVALGLLASPSLVVPVEGASNYVVWARFANQKKIGRCIKHAQRAVVHAIKKKAKKGEKHKLLKKQKFGRYAFPYLDGTPHATVITVKSYHGKSKARVERALRKAIRKAKGKSKHCHFKGLGSGNMNFSSPLFSAVAKELAHKKDLFRKPRTDPHVAFYYGKHWKSVARSAFGKCWKKHGMTISGFSIANVKARFKKGNSWLKGFAPKAWKRKITYKLKK